MLIYRVVDKNNDGMYRNSRTFYEDSLWELASRDLSKELKDPNSVCKYSTLHRAYFDREQHPMPSAILRDERFDGDTFKFGFHSVHVMRKWLLGGVMLPYLEKHGGIVQVFEVSEEFVLYDEDRLQCAFDETKAVLKKTLLPTRFS